jgi:hypothetical protein
MKTTLFLANKNRGKRNRATARVTTGVLVVVFWPVAPLGLLVKRHDVEINKGRIYMPLITRALPQPPAMKLRQANGARVNIADCRRE